MVIYPHLCPVLYRPKTVKEKSRERHNHKPQSFPDTKMFKVRVLVRHYQRFMNKTKVYLRETSYLRNVSISKYMTSPNA